MDNVKENKMPEEDKRQEIILVPRDESEKSDYQPNWTWGKQNTNYMVPHQQPYNFKYPQKSGWDIFWKFIGVGVFSTLCNMLIHSC